MTSREIAEETMSIGQTHNITIYDALYIALTQKINGVFYTADQKLYNVANKIVKTKLLS